MTSQLERRDHVHVCGIYGGVPKEILETGATLKSYSINAVWMGSGSLTHDAVRNLQNQGAMVFAEFNTMHVGEFLHSNPDAAPIGTDGKICPPPNGWQGVCPTHEGYRRNRMQAFQHILETFEIDGIWLDYHHSHASWEQAEPELPDTCFCNRCLQRYSAETKTALPDLPTNELSNILLTEQLEAWVNWRCGVFTDWVREFNAIRRTTRADVLLGTFHCPWTTEERDGALRNKLAIDLRSQLPYVDVFSPMPYHVRFGHKEDLEWIANQIEWLGGYLRIDGSREETKRIWSILQISNWGGEVEADTIEAIFEHGTRLPATGAMAFAWGGIVEQPDSDKKIQAIGQAFRKIKGLEV